MNILDKNEHFPNIKGQTSLPEVTVKTVVVEVILAVIFYYVQFAYRSKICPCSCNLHSSCITFANDI